MNTARAGCRARVGTAGWRGVRRRLGLAVGLVCLLLAGCGSGGRPAAVDCTTLPAPAHGPQDMAFDAEGKLWLAYGISQLEGAVRLVDPAGGMCEHFDRQAGLEMRDVGALAVDGQGDVWLGGWDGDLARFDGRRWRVFRTYDGSADEGNTVFDIAVAPGGEVWVGVPYRAFRFDGREWVAYGVDDGLPDMGVKAVAVAPDGTLWFGGLGPPGDAPGGSSVTSFDGAAWTAYGVGDGLADDDVNDIAVSDEGEVWVGTYRGVSRFAGGGWSSYHADHFVSDATVDAEGGAWFATDRGVLRYDGQAWTAYTEDDGLLGDEVGALAVASDGAIWAGMRDGVCRFHAGVWVCQPVGVR